MRAELPRLMIGGVGSGCGKTTVTNAILQAYCNRKFIPAAFKCGPDYIDPMFHSQVIGIPSRNLDLFLCDENTVRALLAKNSQTAPIALIEGVMGYYDGVGGLSDWASSADLANKTQTPTIIVINVKGKSLSLAAEMKGFLEFQKNTIEGVILNGVTSSMYPFYREIIEKNTGLQVFGYLPLDDKLEIPSRHLGLITAEEIPDLHKKLIQLARLAEACINLDGLMRLASTAPPLDYAPLVNEQACSKPVRIAIAQDRAFCFYYQDSLDLFEQLGAQFVPFSPLTDELLPSDIDGMYLGGGYPELYTQQLTQNTRMLQNIHKQILSGLPTLAECGGFMYLHDNIADNRGIASPMVGIIKGNARLQRRLGNFGYVTLTAQRDNLLCKKGERIRAHEFHYAASDSDGNAFIAQKPLRDRTWPCIHADKTFLAGYPHFHFYANPNFAKSFIQSCERYRRERITECF